MSKIDAASGCRVCCQRPRLLGILKKLSFREKELDDFKAPWKLRSLGNAMGRFSWSPRLEQILVSSLFALCYSVGLQLAIRVIICVGWGHIHTGLKIKILKTPSEVSTGASGLFGHLSEASGNQWESVDDAVYVNTRAITSCLSLVAT